MDAWNKKVGVLEIWDAVIVYGEKADKEVNMISFWGKISKVID